MWTIVPDNQVKIADNELCRLSFTYLHGKLQEDVNTDIYEFVVNEIKDVLTLRKDNSYYIDDKSIKDGIYPCIYQNKECSLYFWHDTMNRPHGLVIYNDDKEELDYVLEQYNIRSLAI